MRIIFIALIMAFTISLGLAPFVSAQEFDEIVIEEPVNVPLDIVLSISQREEDLIQEKRDNIFSINISYSAGENVFTEHSYNILYYLDGEFVTEFKGKTLPFSFERNLRGQFSGHHEIRIDIEDLEGNNVLESDSVSVYVSGD